MRDTVGYGEKTRNPDDLKILIVSTPKTGNTWVRHLLSNVYALPIVTVSPEFDATEMNALGSRWITHQHYQARPDIIDYGRRNNIVFVTTIRHPGDALVSKFHFVRDLFDRLTLPDTNPVATIIQDGDTIGEHTLAYVKHGFSDLLDISLDWMASGESHVVRYEDLWRDPVTTLQELTLSICQVSLERVEQSIELCDIDLMRAMSGDKFFRKGSVGDWKQALPQEIIDLLRHTEPYPTQFAMLGYTLEPDDPLTTLPKKPRVSKNPFHNVTHFDNGVPVPPIAIGLYLSLDPALCKRWADVKQTLAGSFYSWLNAPADQDPRQGESIPIVTNLAYHIYCTRSDLQAAFPDVFGKDRVQYITWWLAVDTRATYHLDQAFTQDAWRSLLRWCDMPAEEDPHHPETAPVLTNLVAHIYRTHQDLHRIFPDPFGQDRFRLAHWFITYAQAEYALDEVFLEPIRRSVRIISQNIPETNDIVPSHAFSLRRKLSSLLPHKIKSIFTWSANNESK